MSNESLSQEEIDKMLNGNGPSVIEENKDNYTDSNQNDIDKLFNTSETSVNASDPTSLPENENNSDNIPEHIKLTDFQKDGLGEIGNISMGTASTTLSVLLNQKVTITTPVVSVTEWDSIKNNFTEKVILVKVKYTKGLLGSSVLLLKSEDSKIISDLMMGGDGSNTSEELSDFHLSAIGEAMNQMIGSSATSMSSMFDEIVDIAPPEIFSKILSEEDLEYIINETGSVDYFVKTSFRLTIGTLIDSEIMQLLALPFAVDMLDSLVTKTSNNPENKPLSYSTITTDQTVQEGNTSDILHNIDTCNNNINTDTIQNNYAHHEKNIVQFPTEKPRNIDMLLSVPMDITVELGRTEKQIKDILDIGPGSIIELDKFQGDKVDIMANGKKIAVGEVVVIDENYGVRITEIVKSKDLF